jgi:hypothetical protein
MKRLDATPYGVALTAKGVRMTIKAGKIITVGNGFLVDRLQTSGPGNLNIPSEKIYETGNELAVATLRDVPDLSYDMESFDVSVETEAMLTGVDRDTVDALPDGTVISLGDAKPLDIISPYKGAGTSKVSVRGVVIPQLTLENTTYRFGVRDSATQSYSLKGDSVYFIPGTPYYQEYDRAVTATGPPATVVAVGPYAFTNTAIKTVEKGDDIFALSACVLYADGSYKRLFHGTDYTDDATGITLVNASDMPVGATLHVTYGSLTTATFAQSIHPTPSVKPAAVRGKDIDLYVAVETGEDQDLVRWQGVQSVEITRAVNVETEDELGNPHHVTSDYDTPDVTGTITMRPGTIEYLWERVAQVTNTPTNEVANLLTSQPLEMQIRISHPETGAVLKTLRIPDARIEPPGPQARANERIEVSMPFSSDSGLLDVIKGLPD